MGIIVRDLKKNIDIYTNLGYDQVSEIVVDNIQHNRVVFLQTQYHSIELIEPLNEKSSIYHFKEGYHHICYEIENATSFLEDFKKLKIGKIFSKPMSAPAINNRNIVFACLTNGTFVEFLF
jgi:catechol 2,3-dioxygenase-like lactoylglutathione lyase family enzyme